MSRFKNAILRNCYENAVKMYDARSLTLFNPDGTRSTGNSIASAFWKGFDGQVIGAGWDSNSKQMLIYAYWCAGRDIAKKG